ncbi:fatty-acyl-CoA synthase [Haloactinospora alba]|uniref:Fatty-acyl-CoA synthase n=1 Tax=Haloactinospora alba TaxID=405555 RepID=A0A543NGU1_9ACTN|nr:AMP-binding protein [Haloactinospora alba]TQN30960.1 fatty-acyl-CoA synthase [Haloactinospora alba]
MTEEQFRSRDTTHNEITLAGLLDAVTAAVPDRLAVIAGPRRMTYAVLNERATRFARHLLRYGIAPGEHVAILSFNRGEWLEAAFGALRAGAVPINVNYRYVAGELRYLLDDADAAALVVERSLAAPVETIRAELPRLRHVVLLDDGTDHDPTPGVDYETAMASAADEPDVPACPGGADAEARYLIYTGGTTGMPKGVVWRQADIFHAALERRRPGEARARHPGELGERARQCRPRRMLVLGPLMHAAGQWNALSMLFNGKTVVLNTARTFDPAEVVALADRESAHIVQLVGDAMARPLAQQLLTQPRLCPSLDTVTSGGTPLTPAVRELWFRWRPGITLTDSYGGSETGVCGAAETEGGTRSFTMGASVAVLDDGMRPLPPGSQQVGRIARSGRIPAGYYNDPEASARTFPVDGEGRRWVMSGDLGMVSEDGTIVLLGRGSAVINTGGEKVYPEEVESVLTAHPEVGDAIVVAAPDESLGQRVAAVISPSAGASPAPDELRRHCRRQLAGFKVPRAFHVVAHVQRTAVGKQDYRWAASVVGGAG